MEKIYGQYGGEVLRTFSTILNGERIQMRSGTLISPEVANGWNIVNRKALSNTQQIRWFVSSFEYDAVAKTQQEQPKEKPASKGRRKKPQTQEGA